MRDDETIVTLAMAERKPDATGGIELDAQKDSLSLHILPTSSTMVGVCMTVIGIVKLLEGRLGPSHVDELFAVNALIFLASAFASYFSMRRNSRRFEAVADAIFMVGLLIMALGGTLFAFELV